MNHVDIAPTSLYLCGIETTEWMEGYDYSHYRRARDDGNRRQDDPKGAFAQLLGDRESGYAWICVVTDDGWKNACVENGEWVLFDLNIDPYKQTNLAFNTKYSQKRNEMNRLLRDWAKKNGDHFEFPVDCEQSAAQSRAKPHVSVAFIPSRVTSPSNELKNKEYLYEY